MVAYFMKYFMNTEQIEAHHVRRTVTLTFSPTNQVITMKHTFIAMLAIAAITSACGSKDVSFDTLETNRSNAKANAEYNAQMFRAASPQYSNSALEVQGDSTQTPDCPQGDGWASAKLVDKTNPAIKVALKCSTVSGTVGCMTADDFQKKPYAADDGRCQPVSKVPFPVPKIAK